MHIPDGYLSPQTYAPLFGVSAGFWAVGLRKMKKSLSVKQVPYLSMAAAFSFLIMMFNIPIPGGTSGHAVGGAIIAILLGPWTAVVAVSVVLIIQAAVFGDGGVTAIGANCFNMAIVLPFVSYYVFRLVNGSAKGGARLYAAAFLSGYAGLVAAAIFTGVEFGIQPIIAAAADGTPLYSPYPLSVALPAMAVGHIFFLGPVEGIVTMLMAGYFFESVPGHAYATHRDSAKFRRALWVAIAAVALLTPLGLYLPSVFNAGGAWGEWGPEELRKLTGYLPEGMRRLGELWKAPLPDYTTGGASTLPGGVSYVLSALTGVAVSVGAVYLLTRLFLGRQSGGRATTPFIDKGIHHVANVIKTTYMQWETASRKGLLQGLDARVKVLATAFFLVIVSLKRDLAPQAAIAAGVFVLAVASRLDLQAYYRRVLVLGFVFGFLIALPSSLNIIVKGDVAVPLVHLSRPYDLWIYHVPAEIGLTSTGMLGVARLTMRVVNSLSLSFLLLYTTPFTEVVRALKVFRVPDTFLMILNLTYKYILIFARTVEDMHLAKKSRLTGSVGGSHARSWIAGRMAMMFKKTQGRCEELYKAMLSRGFTGEVRLAGFGRPKGMDYAAGAVAFVAGAVLIFV